MKAWSASFLIAVAALLVVVSLVRLNAFWTLYSEHVRLDTDYKEFKQRLLTEHQDIDKRLTTIEQVLFGDVMTKLKPQPPLVNIPAWMQRNTDELKDRVTVLERWRLVIDKGKNAPDAR